jgi:hypothetical protein
MAKADHSILPEEVEIAAGDVDDAELRRVVGNPDESRAEGWPRLLELGNAVRDHVLDMDIRSWIGGGRMANNVGRAVKIQAGWSDPNDAGMG